MGLMTVARCSTCVDMMDLEVGMVLSEDVFDPQGRLLLPADTVLTERHLRAFQMWGLAMIRIRGEEEGQPEPAAITPERLIEAEERVRPRFRHNDLGGALVDELFRYCVGREARRAARVPTDG